MSIVTFIDGASYLERPLIPALKKAAENGDLKIVSGHPHPTVVIFSVFGKANAKITNATKVLVCGEPNNYSKKHCHFIIDCKNVPDRRPKNAVFLFFPFYVWSFGERFLNFPQELIHSPQRKSQIETLMKTKTKFCAFMYSKGVGFRNRLYHAVNKYKKTDALGRCLGPPGKKDRNHYQVGRSTYMDLAVKKYKPYKFVICCENSRHPGYITEKIVNAMLAGSIPIYYGAPDVAKHFNSRSFIDVGRFPSFDAAVQEIKRIDTDKKAWRKMLEQPYFRGNVLPKYFRVDYLVPFFKKVLRKGVETSHQDAKDQMQYRQASRFNRTTVHASLPGQVNPTKGPPRKKILRTLPKRKPNRKRQKIRRRKTRGNGLGMIPK